MQWRTHASVYSRWWLWCLRWLWWFCGLRSAQGHTDASPAPPRLGPLFRKLVLAGADINGRVRGKNLVDFLMQNRMCGGSMLRQLVELKADVTSVGSTGGQQPEPHTGAGWLA